MDTSWKTNKKIPIIYDIVIIIMFKNMYHVLINSLLISREREPKLKEKY